MRMEWGRAKCTAGPSVQPVYTYALAFLSAVATLGVQGFRCERVWTPLERHYLGAYLVSQIAGLVRDNGWYTLLQVVTRKGSRLALESDVATAFTESGENTFALTEEALKHGAMRLEFHRSYCHNSEMHAYLGNWIYQNQTLMDLVRPALWAGLVLFFAGLLPAIYLDRKRSIELRYGKRPSRPDLMNVVKHNPKPRFRGFGLVNEKRTTLDRMFSLHKKLPVPPRKENPHVPVKAERSPQEPVKRAAANVGIDRESPARSTRQEATPQKQTPGQEPELEHVVTPSKRRFFE
ncbi:MAG: hypothetical protein WCE61_14780 [Candidatus Acidiferrum sp.]